VTPATAIALSGIAAATLKLNVSASNLANADDTAPVGSASSYQPKQVVDSSTAGGGVAATAVTAKPATLVAYVPTSPAANAQGLVETPEIDPISEISNQIAASQAFAYQLKVLKTAKNDEKSLLDIKS
jgi:flagellar basal-body rod protein FlgC